MKKSVKEDEKERGRKDKTDGQAKHRLLALESEPVDTGVVVDYKMVKKRYISYSLYHYEHLGTIPSVLFCNSKLRYSSGSRA